VFRDGLIRAQKARRIAEDPAVNIRMVAAATT
jgi:hypothetical protein